MEITSKGMQCYTKLLDEGSNQITPHWEYNIREGFDWVEQNPSAKDINEIVELRRQWLTSKESELLSGSFASKTLEKELRWFRQGLRWLLKYRYIGGDKMYRVLDLGCGIEKKVASEYLTRYGINATVIIGLDNLSGWRYKVKELKGIVDVVASAEYLPFRDKAFDTVFSWSCLGFYTEPEAWKEVHRIVKDKLIIDIVSDSARHIEDITNWFDIIALTEYDPHDEDHISWTMTLIGRPK